ncbi:MAG: S-layer homology domain-containing protein, partial [Dethiobacteria bacterium]
AQLPETTDAPAFSDSAKIADWAQQAVAAASASGTINGYPDNTFRPQGQATRAEAATVIVKALK